MRSLRLGCAAEEAVDDTARRGADMAVAVGRDLLQHGVRRHPYPMAVDHRAPRSILGYIGARRPAVAEATVGRAVAAGVARAGLLQVLVPVMVFHVSLAVKAFFRLCGSR